MAGYSGTPLAKKLGIKDAARVLADSAPAHFGTLLEPLPAKVKLESAAEGQFDVIVTFARDIDALAVRFQALIPHLAVNGGLWVAWPKKSSGLYVPGLSENAVRDALLPTGLVDTKVCAIDEDWSGLRFVRRLTDRAK